MNTRCGLAAGGLVVALAVAVVGCASAGSVPAGSTAAGTPSTSASTSSPTASSGASPSWAAALGPGTTVAAPTSAAPGLGSPQATVTGDERNIASGRYLADCAYLEPTQQAACKTAISGVQASLGPSATAAPAGSVRDFAIGYTAIHGNEALVGTTGTFCSPDQGSSPSCFTNTNPAAIFSAGKSFAALWSESIAAENDSSVYSLVPCVEVDHHWYLDEQV
jgi:hypothetical protein